MTVKPVLLAALAVASLTMAVRAQYTPGSGIYVAPSQPMVPVPAPQQAPQPPSRPAYSWEQPAQPAQPVYAPPQPAYPPTYQSTPVLQPAAGQAVQVVQPPVYIPQLTDAQIADLTASIALYPDPLLAEMLPAATYMEELTYADRWLTQQPEADERVIEGLPVSDSVKSIMHYPTVLALMVEHVDWTQSLGMAFLYQRQDVMDSVQRWRVTAVSCGTLYSNPQLEVVQQGSIVVIQPPARAQVIFVPVYDPAVVYVRPLRPAPRNVITFAGGGFSLSFVENDVDWHDHQVRVPVRRDDRDVPREGGGMGGRGSPAPGGRGTIPSGSTVVTTETKTVFVHDTLKPGVMYPQKVVTPQPDKKVVTIPAPTGRGAWGAPVGPGGTGSPRSGGRDGNPATPF